MDKTQLPAEVMERIDLEAKQFAFFNYVSAAHNQDAIFEDIKTWPNRAAASYYSIKNYMIGRGVCWPYERPPLPTEYAIKLHEAQQEIAQLKRWKMEASELLNPILDYGQSKEAGIPLGESITAVMLKRCKQAKEARILLEKVIYRHEGGLLPDRLLYNEIKSFLDGTKQ